MRWWFITNPIRNTEDSSQCLWIPRGSNINMAHFDEIHSCNLWFEFTHLHMDKYQVESLIKIILFQIEISPRKHNQHLNLGFTGGCYAVMHWTDWEMISIFWTSQSEVIIKCWQQRIEFTTRSSKSNQFVECYRTQSKTLHRMFINNCHINVVYGIKRKEATQLVNNIRWLRLSRQNWLEIKAKQ